MNTRAVVEITLDSSGEDAKITLVSSGEDAKNTLVSSVNYHLVPKAPVITFGTVT